MKKSKKITLSALALTALVGAGAYGVGKASAFDGPGNQDNFATKLAEKFNLNKDDVTKFLEEEHAAHRAEMETQRQQVQQKCLTQAVQEGKITEAQKKLIENKITELDKKRTEDKITYQNLSDQERMKLHAEHRAEIQKWAQENGIDESYLMIGAKRGGEKGFGPGEERNKSAK